MSTTKDFDDQDYDPTMVTELLNYARSLESLLADIRDDVADCANLQAQYESYRPDRYKGTLERLAKIDEVLKEVGK